MRPRPGRRIIAEHLSVARQQPELVDFGVMLADAGGYIERDSIISLFDLIKVFPAGQPDITRKIVGRHVRPLDYGLDSLPIILLFSHFFSNN